MKRNKLAVAVAGLLLIPAGAAFAQSAATDPSTQPSRTKELQAVTVTGSALPRVDTETPSPVTVITAKQIERSGLKTISDVVRALSADNSGSIGNSFSNGFAAGASGVSLRGLTVNSTLVLIDGRRSASYGRADDGQRSFVDLNSIPMVALDRIEVLKDGASSLYGADAIAGVVNIILKHDFKGAQGTFEYGDSQHGGGMRKRATLLFGGGDLAKDGFNAYGSIEAQKDDAIHLRDRGFPYDSSDLSRIGGANLIGGQPGLRSGSFYGTVRPGSLAMPGDITTGVPVNGSPYSLLQPCGPGSNLVNNGSAGQYCSQDFLQYQNAQPETKRLGFYGRLTVKVGDTSEAYLGISYYQNKTRTTGRPAQIQATSPNNAAAIALPPTLSNGQPNPNNPYAAPGYTGPYAGDDALINYAFGNRRSESKNHNVRFTGGMHGTLGEWNYDSALVLNQTSLDQNLYGYLNYKQLLNDINDGSYNFRDRSRNSPAVLAALMPALSKNSTTDLQSLDFHVSRPLMDLRGGELGFAVGADARHESANDPELNPGNATQDLGIAHTLGHRSAGGLYTEFDAPVLEQLELNVSGRLDDYSDVGTAFSPKAGIKWKPIDSLAIRGTFSRGFRPPNFAENGSSESIGFATYPLPDDYRAAHDQNNYVRNYPLGYDTVGNKSVKPERSKSYTFGVVYQPIDQLSASADYYDIKKTGVISASSSVPVLNAYFAGLPLPPNSGVIADKPDPDFPNLLPKPVIVQTGYANQNSLHTKGVDINLVGRFDLWGRTKLISEFNATKIFSWDLTLRDGTKQRYAGTHGPNQLSSGAGTPQYRASWATSVLFGAATITGTFYYTSGESLTAADAGEGCLSQGADGVSNFPSSCRLSSFTTFDLTGSYDINQHFQLYASVLNAFARKAPLDPLNYAGSNSPYNPTYDQSGVVGRFYTLGVKFKM